MNSIKLTDIIISENRQRREFDPDALMDLTESIRDNGLLQPIVVRLGASGPVLVAGERRLRAIKDLWELGGQLRVGQDVFAEGIVPVMHLGDLNPLQAEEAELDENLRRKDLTWQEQADAIRRLHSLRAGQAAAKGELAPTVATTAKEVHGRADGSFHDDTRKAIIIAGHLSDPDVAKARTQNDAWKILKRKEEVQKNEALAVEVGKTFNSKMHTLLNVRFQDSRYDLNSEGGKYDVILTDPPYGMGADEFSDAGGALVGHTHRYKDDYEHWLPLMREFTHFCSQVTKFEAHVYAFCDIERFPELRQLFLQVGFEVHRTPLIWTKPQSHRVPWPDYGPRRHWESILYAVKGKRKTTAIYPDVIECKLDENLGHPAQKPVELFTNLLKRSVRPGDKVLDPFCGTGPIFAAAHDLKCIATGIELDTASYGIALKRLQRLDDQAELGL